MSATIATANGLKARLVEGEWTASNLQLQADLRELSAYWRDRQLSLVALGDREAAEAVAMAEAIGGRVVALKPEPPPANVSTVIY